MKKTRNTIKSIYSEIRELLFKMIPEKWESIYLYASVLEDKNHSENGEMFFFYYPKSFIKRNPINVFEVPTRFNINEQDYMRLAVKLYNLIKKLRHTCKEIDNILWSNITISIENVEFLAEYNMDDLLNSPYNADDRRNIWKYKYLNYPIERMNKNEKETLNRYLQEEEWGGHPTTIYSETFYQKHEHNNIEYNKEEYEQEENVYEQEIIRKDNKYNISTNNIEENKIKNQLLKFDK